MEQRHISGMRHHLISGLSAILLAACGQAAPPPTAGGAEAGCSTRAYDTIGGPITLVDDGGSTVTEADFKGAPSLVFFGFTYCPDICPGTLVTLDRAIDRLPEDVAPPRTILITVDPERDTPDVLAQYLSTPAFPSNSVGLTGTDEQVRAAADAFKADYSRIEAPQSLGEYTMDHTSLVYLMDEDWSLKTFFTHQDTDESIATCLAELL